MFSYIYVIFAFTVIPPLSLLTSNIVYVFKKNKEEKQKKTVIDLVNNSIKYILNSNLIGLISVFVCLYLFDLLKIQGVILAYTFSYIVYNISKYSMIHIASSIKKMTLQKQFDTKYVAYMIFMASIFLSYIIVICISLLHSFLKLNIFPDVSLLRIQDSKDILKLIISFIFTSYIIKFSGNFMTKIGDIVSDYTKKIVLKKEEDKSIDKFSILDNIGDIIGDLYGNIIDLISIFLIFSYLVLFKYVSMSNIFQTLCLASIFKLSIMTILLMISSEFLDIKKMMSNFLALHIIMQLLRYIFDSFIMKYLFFKSELVSTLIIKNIATTSLLFIILIVIFFIDKTYHYASLIYIKMTSKLGILSTMLTPIFAGILMIETITRKLQILFLFSLNGADFFSSMYFSNIDFILTSVYFLIIHLSFSVLSDSICGLYKKLMLEKENINNESKNTIKDIAEYKKMQIKYENFLEECDNSGNKAKISIRLIISTMFITSVYMVSVIPYSTSFNLSVIPIVLLPFILIQAPFIIMLYYVISNQNMSEKSLYTKCILNSQALFSGIFLTIFRINYSDLAVGFIPLLLLSSYYALVGGILDISKKKSEMKEVIVQEETHKELIKHDLIGDVMKDIMAPSFFSVAGLLLLKYIFEIIKNY